MRSFVAILTIAPSVLFTASAHADCWEQVFKLLAIDGGADDFFGASVAINGDTAIVGAAWNDDFGSNSGSAYLYDTTTGRQIAKLLPNDGSAGDNFGVSVAIGGATAIVGAPYDDDNGEDSGASYVFDATTGELRFKLLPNDGAAFDLFGNSVAIGGDFAIVGANHDDDNGFDSGSAYLFNTVTGRQIGKLLPDDGYPDDCFGYSVAIRGDTAVVGAFGDDDNGGVSGSAYLFDTATGEQIAKLLPDDGTEGDLFGLSVAISGTTAIVGAPFDDHNGPRSGSAYLFDTTTGEQIAKLLPEDGAARDGFGWSIAIDGTAIVGAPGDDDNGTQSGSAYLFDIATGWQIAKLLPDNGAEWDSFGDVAISAGTALVGAPDDDDNGLDSGSAYLFDVGDCGACVRNPEWQCDGDVDGDGQVNPVDSGIVQANFGNTNEQALCNYDLDCDGQINPVDSGIVQSLFGTCEAPRGVCP